MAGIEDYKRADEIAQAVIKLIQRAIGEIFSTQVVDTVSPDLRKGWDLISQNDSWGEIEPIEKWKSFVKEVMEIGKIENFQRAEEIAHVVINLFQVNIGETLSRKVSDSVPPDLKKGWDIIALSEKGLYI